MPPCISIHAPAKGATHHPYARQEILHDFNPRSREGSDQSYYSERRGKNAFQSTLPRRERHIKGDLNGKLSDFNPRSREGSDACCALPSLASCPFQSTLPRRERHNPRRKAHPDLFNFNPRSREGSDQTRSKWKLLIMISIHAPAKGATVHCPVGCVYCPISIHAPAKGATPWLQRKMPKRLNFNPRSREGSDNFLA